MSVRAAARFAQGAADHAGLSGTGPRGGRGSILVVVVITLLLAGAAGVGLAVKLGWVNGQAAPGATPH
jgi:hypothetical protein